MATSTVLVVDDEREIREMLRFVLERADFAVSEAASVEEARNQLEGPLPGVILIDWMLPGTSGLDFVRQLRRDSHTADIPLMMLTAKGEEAEKLKSFEVGVDDYVTKPFSPRELIARIRAMLRRAGTPDDGLFDLGELSVDTRSHRVSFKGEAIHIGPTEFRLLEFLLRNRDRAFDRAQLLDRVWGRSVYLEERTVDVHVLRLRKILAPLGLAECLQTVRGVGYRLSNP